MTREIRRATAADLARLQAFFATAYGARTIFQNADFLSWHLGGDGRTLNSCIALDETGAVLSHYGWIPVHLFHRGKSHPLSWGVNAFTLPEVRGQGLGKELVEVARSESLNFGVIGFSEKAVEFYDSLGFNMFGKRRFQRHVLVLDPAIREIMAMIGTAEHPMAEALTHVVAVSDGDLPEMADPTSWSDDPIESLAAFCTPVRSKRWLEWRYSPRSQLEYHVLYHHSAEYGRALLAFRAIEMAPTSHWITRIIDLYGDSAAVQMLVRRACCDAINARHLYVEFSSFAGPYAEILEQLHFVVLQDDDYAVLPSLTNPVGRRPNHEYVGLSSATPELFARLSADETYFTLADSDRDRRGIVST